MAAGAANSSLLDLQLKQFVFENYFCHERILYRASLLGKT